MGRGRLAARMQTPSHARLDRPRGEQNHANDHEQLPSIERASPASPRRLPIPGAMPTRSAHTLWDPRLPLRGRFGGARQAANRDNYIKGPPRRSQCDGQAVEIIALPKRPFAGASDRDLSPGAEEADTSRGERINERQTCEDCQARSRSDASLG